jgi:hypothetical protein
MRLIDRIADRVDLAVDLLTLGQYGLEWDEPSSAPDAGCEGGARRREHREALPPGRGRGCERAGRDAQPQPAG